MPGSGSPVFGSSLATLVAATVGGLLAVGALHVADEAIEDRSTVTAVVGIAYAFAGLGTWAAAQEFSPVAPFSPAEYLDPGGITLLAVAAGWLFLQAAIPAYVYAHERGIAPLSGLFLASVLSLLAPSVVGGEAPTIFFFALFVGPVGVALAALPTEANPYWRPSLARLIGARGDH